MKRRDFLQTTALASASLFVPKLITASALDLSQASKNARILIVIQWSGGNDGLNTVIPFTDDLYYKLRPSLAIPKTQILPIGNELGLHPKLLALKDMYDNGELAVVENVGYPEPDRSHFRSMDIWHSASDSNEYVQSGWIGRILDQGLRPDAALEIDDSLSLAMKGEIQKGLAIRNINQAHKLSAISKLVSSAHSEHEHEQVSYLKETLRDAQQGIDYIYDQTGKHVSKTTYPDSELGRQLKSIGELINSGCSTTIYYVTLGGFDTHVGQPGAHNRLFDQYSQAVNALRTDLKLSQKWKDVAILTFSEFGRRVKENAGKGTDHGTAGVSFVMSGGLKNAGIYGGNPDLSTLSDGDLIHKIDFRSLYTTLLDEWLEVDSSKIISKIFGRMGLFVEK